MANFNSSKLHLQSVLAERKTSIVLGSSEKLLYLEEKMQNLKLIRCDPKAFLHNFFADLKTLVNLKADEARAKIDKDQWMMNQCAKNYETKCAKSLDDLTLRDEMNRIVDELIGELSKNCDAWNESLSEQRVLSEDEAQNTKLEIDEFYKKVQSKFDEIKEKLFRGRVFKLETVDTSDLKFGELVARSSKNIQNEGQNNDDGQVRPQSKLIRFELRPAKKISPSCVFQAF
jgi:hypothetical protein